MNRKQNNKRRNGINQEEPTHVVKIVLIGDSSVGKTNLLTRFCENEFTSDSMPTIGVEFGSKIVEINEQIIKAQIWDTAGQERFRSVTQVYYRSSIGAFIVYDITNSESFERLDDWVREFKEQSELNAIPMIIGNKCDLEKEREISKEMGENFAKENGLSFIETSAKDGTNVEYAFRTLIEEIYNVLAKKKYEDDPLKIINPHYQKQKKGCC
ncbi:ras-related protein rab-11c [Anaeramoeba ignava]|uniref:Ras-related protein rab-11c n=1 Tax=Anaeramoeba ignava TaxID=1746090 RepID=A0A9Q0LTR7_ANAIG|nr:ras-related protein rab-11c [Anaeramoeba ignava]